MDALSETLHTLCLQSRLSFFAPWQPPWGFRVEAKSGFAPFYLLVKGECVLEAGAHRVLLKSGDLALLPHGDAHRLCDAPSSPTPTLEAALAALTPSQGDALLLAGEFRLQSDCATLLFPSKTPFVQPHDELGCAGSWRQTLVQILCSEQNAAQPGANLAISRLLDLLFLEIVRAEMHALAKEERNAQAGFLRALADPQIAQALAAIHQNPERPWTVATLAAQAGMSRTAFAVRFAKEAGIAPISYLAHWRMLKARELIRHSDAPLFEIAAQVGFDSDAAFSKAFKRATGLAPRRYREQIRAKTFKTETEPF